MKPHKLGFKIHMICGSESKYLYNLYFDPGKFGKEIIYFEDNTSKTESIVLRLFLQLKIIIKDVFFSMDIILK